MEYTDAYNVGLNYLMDKYPSFVTIIKTDSQQKPYKIPRKSIYIHTLVNTITDNDDKEIALNVKDYYLGISVKKALERNLENKGIKFGN